MSSGLLLGSCVLSNTPTYIETQNYTEIHDFPNSLKIIRRKNSENSTIIHRKFSVIRHSNHRLARDALFLDELENLDRLDDLEKLKGNWLVRDK
jgi:hypothetical protein